MILREAGTWGGVSKDSTLSWAAPTCFSERSAPAHLVLLTHFQLGRSNGTEAHPETPERRE